MFLKLIFLFGFVIVAEMCTTGCDNRPPCLKSIQVDFKAKSKYDVEKKHPNCFGRYANLTKEEKEKVDWACISKCTLENDGIFDRNGKFVETGIREYYTKFSNATENYIKAIEKIYVDCKKSSDVHISEMKKNGSVVTKCTFYRVFDACGRNGRWDVKDC